MGYQKDINSNSGRYKILGADRWMTGKNKSKYRHIDILTYEQEIADQENHFLMVVHPRRNLQE